MHTDYPEDSRVVRRVGEEDTYHFARHAMAAADMGPWLPTAEPFPADALCAAGVLFAARSTGRVLLARTQGCPFWSLCGGLSDHGETLVETARREALEEAGVEAAIIADDLIFAVAARAYGTRPFRHATFLAVVDDEFDPSPEYHREWETFEWGWFRPGAWPSPLHPGFQALLCNPDATARLSRIPEAEFAGNLSPVR